MCALQALTHLDLDANVVGDEGAAALAVALGGCALRALRLHDNGVGDAGAAALASALCAAVSIHRSEKVRMQCSHGTYAM